MPPVTDFKLTHAGDVALVTIDNGEDWTKPTFFGEAALASLDRVLAELERGDFRAAVITGKPFFFAAGADITEFPGISRERAIQGARAGHELFGRLRALPFPTVAAINGACLGGGVELALHCTARTISSAVRHFAFPEVFLGLFPAWGGTQLLPRIVGPEAAIKVIVSNPLRQNRMLRAAEVAQFGIADRLLEPVEFVDESLAFARELAQRKVERAKPDWSDAETIFRRARTAVDDAVHRAAPAPYTALDPIEGAQEWTIEEGYRREEEAIGELLPGPQAQASLYAFHLVEQRAKRLRPPGQPRRVEKVGIVGAGLMARQIAALILRRLEVPLVIRDVKQEIVDEAIAEIGAEAKTPFLASIVSGGTTYDGFADCDLVLEAVFEELDVKRQVFSELENVVGDDCILATNTSALSITDMAAELRRPEQELERSCKAVAVSFLGLVLINFVVFRSEAFSRYLMVSWFTLACLLLVAMRFTLRALYEKFWKAGLCRRRAVLTGSPAGLSEYQELLSIQRHHLQGLVPGVAGGGLHPHERSR